MSDVKPAGFVIPVILGTSLWIVVLLFYSFYYKPVDTTIPNPNPPQFANAVQVYNLVFAN